MKSFPVEPRVHALKIWIRSENSLCDECTHIFLAEPDYVFVKPPRFPIPPRGEAIGFTYDYVAPNYGEIKKVRIATCSCTNSFSEFAHGPQHADYQAIDWNDIRSQSG